MKTSDALSRVRFFSKVPAAQVEASADLWTHRHLQPGDVLWEQGSFSESMAILVGGAVDVLSNERVVSRIDPGQLLGELSAFTVREARTASLRAASECELLELSLDRLPELAHGHVSVYNAMLDAALEQSVRRINAADLQIARRAEGTAPAPTRRAESAIRKLWQSLTRSDPKSRPPGVVTLLRHLHGLFSERDNVLGELSGALTAVQVKEGQPIFLEGETGASVFLVGDTEIEILRNVGHGEARRLVLLGPGSLVGTGTLILGGGRRSASGVPTMDGWVYEMTHEQHEGLTGLAARAWKEALMGEIRGQIITANGILSELGDPKDT